MLSSRTPRLSVVTISYNDPRGLDVTLSSLEPLFREWPASAWEHVVVDSSPSLTRPVLAALPREWPLIHVEQTPQGVFAAFNRALVLAQGTYLWFLNGGDRLYDLTALEKVLRILDRDAATDLVSAGAYLTRRHKPLYPISPWRTFLRNLLGRSWMYHQAVVYRSAPIARVGPYSTSYAMAGDYDFHIRCYLAGLRGRFLPDLLAAYDMTGGSTNVVRVFEEFRQIQRSHRAHFPSWVNWANEVVRTVEYARIRLLHRVARTRLGRRLRPLWWKLKRVIYAGRASMRS